MEIESCEVVSRRFVMGLSRLGMVVSYGCNRKDGITWLDWYKVWIKDSEENQNEEDQRHC